MYTTSGMYPLSDLISRHCSPLITTVVMTVLLSEIGGSNIQSYEDICNRTFELGTSMFAGKLEFRYKPNRRINGTFVCKTVITTLPGYSLSLLFQYPLKLSQCQEGEPCCNSRIDLNVQGTKRREYCFDYHIPKYEITMHNETTSVVFENDNLYEAFYTILFFTFYQGKGGCLSPELTCNNQRCIDKSIACETEYKFCNDDTDICKKSSSDTVDTTTSFIPYIAGIVTATFALIVVVTICFVCKTKLHLCKGSRWFRGQLHDNVEAHSNVSTIWSTMRNENVENRSIHGHGNIPTVVSLPPYSVLEHNMETQSYRLTNTQRHTDNVYTVTNRDALDKPPAYDSIAFS